MDRISKFKIKCNHFAVANYSPIPDDKIISAKYSLSNSACHFNAVAAVKAGRADKVWMVWAGGARGCIHFINSKGGLFFDETWHEYDSKHSYRLIRLIRDSEYSEISDILLSAKMMMFFCCGSFIDKLLSRGKIHSWI